MSGPKKIVTNRGENFFRSIADHLKLVWRLWLDSRVNPLLKLLPFGALVYFISPIDLPTPIDDIGVVWAFTQFFIELCPPDVVSEHRAEIQKIVIANWKETEDIDIDKENIVDADFRDKSEEK